MASQALKLSSKVEGKDGVVNPKGNNLDLNNNGIGVDSKHAVDDNVYDTIANENAIDYLENEEHPIDSDLAYPVDNFDLSDTIITDFEINRQLNYDSDFGDLLGIPCLDSVISIESFDITNHVYLHAEPLESTNLVLENIEDLFHDNSIGNDSLFGINVSESAKLYDSKVLEDVNPIDTMPQVHHYLQTKSLSTSRERMPLDDSSIGRRSSDAVKEYRCHLCKSSYVTFQDFELHCQSHYDDNNNTRLEKQTEKTCNIFEIFDEINLGSKTGQQSENNNLFSKHNNNHSVTCRENEALENSNIISVKNKNNPSPEVNDQSIQYSQPSDNNSLTARNKNPKTNQTDCQSGEEENNLQIHTNNQKTTDTMPVEQTAKRINPLDKNGYDVSNVVRNDVVEFAIVTTPGNDDNVDHSKQRKHIKKRFKGTSRSATKEANSIEKESPSSHGNHITPEQSDLQIHFCQKCGKSFNRLNSLQSHLRDHETTGQVAQREHLKTFKCSICNKSFKNEQRLEQHKVIHSIPKPYKCDVCSRFFRRKKTLERHCANHDREEPDLVGCGVCGKLYKIKTLRYHIESHNHKKRFNCEVCDRSFNEKHVLESHTRMHTGSKPYECHICHKRFASKPILHMRLHSGEKPYECDVCGKRFNIFKNMRRHLIIHTELKPYQCEVCEKSFNDPGALKTHKRIHTGETPYACDVCDKAFRTSCDLTRHRHVHSGYKPFKCHMCGKCFQQRYNLRSHLEIHTGYTKNFKCDVCCKSFRRKGSLKTHMKTHTGEKPFKCPICSKGFSTASSLSLHDRVHTKEKPFSCNECGRTFSLRSNMTRHIRTHTGETPYKCLICDKQFTNQNSVLYHEQMHQGDKPHKCDVCDKSFQSKNHVQQHLRRNHYGEKRFKCIDCAKTFKSNTELKSHSKTHSEEKNYKCEVCNKSFKHKSSTRLHMMSHAGDKPYKCDVCCKQFTSSRERNVHMQCHTRDKSECNICEKEFSSKSGLSRHMKNIHIKCDSKND